MGKSTVKQTTTTIRIINNNKEIKYFKLHNHTYVLVDLVFVIKRNLEHGLLLPLTDFLDLQSAYL